MSLYDAAYLVGGIFLFPWLVIDAVRRRRGGWGGRLGRGAALPKPVRRRVLLHAVSVGEVNAIRQLVDQLREAGFEVAVSVTTDTGFRRAHDLWTSAGASNVWVVRYPLDFSWCVRRFLDRVRPAGVATVELELWPNLQRECARRGIPTCVVNGRLSARSYSRYTRIRPLIRRTFGRLQSVGAQNEAYAQRFRYMGASVARVEVTGNMKWDTAQIAASVPGAQTLADELGIDRNRPLVVAGSTGPGEEALLDQACPPGVQLLCAPRKPERFNEAASAMPGCGRRSDSKPKPGERFLLDTIGELRQAYALADIVIVGRSFLGLHGSDMMEPIALGKATVIGPHHSDFAESTDLLLKGAGLVVTNKEELSGVISDLLSDPNRRTALAASGRQVIRQQQGATERNCALIRKMFDR